MTFEQRLLEAAATDAPIYGNLSHSEAKTVLALLAAAKAMLDAPEDSASYDTRLARLQLSIKAVKE